MKTNLRRVLNLKEFFKLSCSSNHNSTYILEKPSKMLLQNLCNSWLQFSYAKTSQQFTIYLSENESTYGKNIFQGCITPYYAPISEIVVENDKDEIKPMNSKLMLSLSIPQQDVMQYFLQWQRYRKYWWSSVTTTPSLFAVNDIKYGDDGAEVNILANFDCGPQVVETITINNNHEINSDTSSLSCSMPIEKALFTLLLDGLCNSTKEGYLRLHNQMAPYKFSFALKYEDPEKESILKDLASLLFYRLELKKISTWLPSFLLPIEPQIKENLHMGVTYTAILSENTLANGIFNLLNSSTMLQEQIHIADFENYAALLCGK